MKIFWTTLYFSILSLGARSAYYDTLPKNVRTFVYKQVSTDTINSSFGFNNIEKSFYTAINVDSSMLNDLSGDPQFTNKVASLKLFLGADYDNLKIASYEIDPIAEVEAKGIGFGWGLTNKLTAYVSIPYIEGHVKTNLKKTSSGNVAELVEKQAEVSSLRSTELDQTIEELTSLGAVQSIITSEEALNYYPLGSWQGKALGDIELGMMYKVYEKARHGASLTGGIVLPTGKLDHPDILQDISFGDGQTDAFIGANFGYSVIPRFLNVGATFRYTHQFSSDRLLRVPESIDVPIGATKATFKEKLGNMYDLTLSTMVSPFTWLDLEVAYSFHYKEQSEYKSSDTYANAVLGFNTYQEIQSIKLATYFTTVNLYQQKKFFLPFKLGVSMQKMISGKNTPNYSRFDMEAQFFF